MATSGLSEELAALIYNYIPYIHMYAHSMYI